MSTTATTPASPGSPGTAGSTTAGSPTAESPAAGPGARATGPGRAVVPLDGSARLTFLGVMKGEWIKLLSLRSTWWTMGITVAVMTLLGLAQASSLQYFAEDAAAAGATLYGAEVVIGGYQFATVTIAVLGALLMTGEYSTGMIRSTFAAVPSRLPVLAAKGLALVVVTVVVSAASIVGAYLVARPALGNYDLVPSLSDATTWQAFGGMTFFFVAAAFMALGLGAVVRHTAGTITAVLGLLLLLPGVLQFVQIDWVQDLVAVLPLPAAVSFLSLGALLGTNELLSPWQGVAVVSAWAVAALVAGAVSLRRRDA
ncbi:ABC-2 type transport system permease protein [Georgenia soli]|uniref:ABC-2 type transport system permease protein n=1 Tax=Georgenia soli TaxID=638953 RepID=A0A2A9EKJ8_9MICO|nr:ABC transporter permease subunit [Georgenia soli]PFG39474.1 ABC-2 type transport system permease protein [Georgenia soli]